MSHGGPFICYRELIAPNNVILASFFTLNHGKYEFLLTATVSTIRVYKICKNESIKYPFLSLCSSLSVFGVPRSMKTFSDLSSDGDCNIVLTCDNGKILLLRFDKTQETLVAYKLFNAEEGASGVGSEVKADSRGRKLLNSFSDEPYVDIDASSSYACVSLCSQQLMFIPLQSYSSLSSNVASEINGKKTLSIGLAAMAASKMGVVAPCTTRPQFMIDLLADLLLVGPILDFCFVDGYTNLTVAVLQDAGPLPIGHACRVLHTTVLTVLTIDPALHSASILWQHTNLPHDAIRILSPKQSQLCGGVVVVSVNALMVVTMDTVNALATNGFASASVHPATKLQPWPLVEACQLDGSHWFFADDNVLIGALRDGGVLEVRLWCSSADSCDVRVRFHVDLLGTTIPTSSVCRNADGSLWFFGSALADSLLLNCQKRRPRLPSQSTENDLMWSVLGNAGAATNQQPLSAASGNKTSKDCSTPLPIRESLTLNYAAGNASPSVAGRAVTGDDSTLSSIITPMSSNNAGVNVTPSLPSSIALSSGNSATPATKRVRRLPPRSKSEKSGQFDAHGNSTTPGAGNAGEISISVENSAEILSEELKLYGIEQKRPSNHWQALTDCNFFIEIADVLPSLGPVLGGTFSSADDTFESVNALDWSSGASVIRAPSVAAASYIAPRESKESLILTSGVNDFGSLNRVDLGLRLSKITTKEFPLATSAQCVPLSANDGDNVSLLVLSFTTKTKVFLCSEKSVTAGRDGGMPSRLESGEFVLREIQSTDSSFFTTSQTILTGLLYPASNIVVQVFPAGLRIIQFTMSSTETEVDGMPNTATEWTSCALQDVLVADELDMGGLGGTAEETIVIADLVEDYIVVLTSLRSVHVLKYNHDDQYLACIHSATFPNEIEIPSKSKLSVGATCSELLEALPIAPVTVSLFCGSFPRSSSSKVGVETLVDERQSLQEPTEDRSPRIPFDSSIGQFASPGAALSPDNRSFNVSGPKLEEFEEALLYGGAIKVPDDSSAMVVDSCQSPCASSISRDFTSTPITTYSLEVPEVNSTTVQSNKRSRDAESSSLSLMNESPIIQAPRSSKQMHLVIGDAKDSITILCLSDMRIVFQATKISHFRETLAINPEEDINDPDDNSVTISQLQLCDVRVDRINRLNGPHEQSRLCLVALFDTGDFVVYHAVEPACSKASMSIETESNGFVKLEHSVVSHCHRSRHARAKRLHDLSVMNEVESGDTIRNLHPILTNDELAAFRLRRAPMLGGHHGILIPGPLPQVVFAEQGFPTVIGLSFPELPFSNSGRYDIFPLDVGSIHGIVSIWQETASNTAETKSPATSALLGSGSGSIRRLVGLYQCAGTSRVLFPGATATVTRVSSKQMLRHIAELLPKSDDKTELALLQKKTFVAAASSQVLTPFVSSVLTPEELEVEQQLYDRFIDDMASFKQPDPAVGAAPKLVASQHKVVLVQGGAVVDEYVLPLNEEILGLEALYLTVERKADAAVINALNAALGKNIVTSTLSKRVFVAACTGIKDKHGEDTQGEGRLLLFSLDYKVHSPVDSTASSSSVGASSSGTNVGGDQGPNSVAASASVSSAQPDQLPSVQFSATQNHFLHSISPKLRLLWTGPGPCSIVKQFGENIIATVGASVYIYKLNPETFCLDQISFFFAKFYVSSVSVIRNYLMICDVCNSVQFLVWREADFSLTPLAQDFDKHICLSSAFLWDGPAVGLVVGDNEANLQMLQFNPRKIESIQGTRLLVAGDFHLGSECNLLLSHALPTLATAMNGVAIGGGNPMTSLPGMPGFTQALQQRTPTQVLNAMGVPITPPPPPGTIAKETVSGAPFATTLDKQNGQRACIITATTDGSLGILIPMDEKMYRRLGLLYQIMCMGVPSSCAMNAKEFRSFKVSRPYLGAKRGVLDGTMLWRYGCLTLSLQDELAAVIGTTREVILENLTRLDKFCKFF